MCGAVVGLGRRRRHFKLSVSVNAALQQLDRHVVRSRPPSVQAELRGQSVL